jgi:hypothetical protein
MAGPDHYTLLSLQAQRCTASPLRRIYRLDYEERAPAATKKSVNRPPKLRHSGAQKPEAQARKSKADPSLALRANVEGSRSIPLLRSFDEQNPN